jgi:uncharacterized membrane protein
MRFEEMGIVTDRGTLCRSIFMGLCVAALALAGLFTAGAVRGEDPLFSLHVSGDISRITYILVAPLQEVLAKSVMYYGFERCIGREHPWRIVLLCALVFGIFHVVYGIRMMLLAMLLTVLTGWMFRLARCVWGCAIVHFVLGFFPCCFGFG